MIRLNILPEDAKLKEFPDMQIISGRTPDFLFSELGVLPHPLSFKTPITLIKIGEANFMKKLLEDGEVYMQTTTHFRELENGKDDCSDGRGDTFEGVDIVLQAKEITIAETTIKNISPIRGKYSNNNDGLIYSTYGVFDDTLLVDGNLTLSDEMKKMGDAAIVIYDPMIFLDRCATYLENIGGKLMAGSVTYYDENIGDYTLCPWLKRKRFEYQSEYRLFIPCGNRNPLLLRLGSIEDIAVMKTWR